MGKIFRGSPKQPQPDPEIERRRREEQRKADEEKERLIQDRLKNETLIGSSGTSRNSLLSRGRQGFQLRSLLGGR